MIDIIYEGRKYSFSQGGWVDEKNISVPGILSTFLSRQAVKDGIDPSLFGGKKELQEKAKVSVVKRVSKKKSSKFNLKKGISLD
jgi:hypothetical protein